MEKDLAEILSTNLESENIDPNFLIIKSMRIKSVRIQSRDDEGSIILLSDKQQPKSFENESTLFRSIDEEQNDYFIDVYAPIYFSNDYEKRKKIETCESLIHEFLNKIVE